MTDPLNECPQCGELLERDSIPLRNCPACGFNLGQTIEDVKQEKIVMPKVPSRKPEAKKPFFKPEPVKAKAPKPTKPVKPEPVKAKKKKK